MSAQQSVWVLPPRAAVAGVLGNAPKIKLTQPPHYGRTTAARLMGVEQIPQTLAIKQATNAIKGSQLSAVHRGRRGVA